MFRKIIALALTLSFVMGGTSLAVWYTCKYEGCNYGTARLSDLKKHERTHTKEKPYHCNHAGCNSTFSDQSALIRHKQTHTKDRPFECTHKGCDYNAARSSHLKRHEKRKHPGGIPTIEESNTQLDELGKRPRPADIEVNDAVPPSKMPRILTDGAESPDAESTDDESPDKTNINFLLNPESTDDESPDKTNINFLLNPESTDDESPDKTSINFLLNPE